MVLRYVGSSNDELLLIQYPEFALVDPAVQDISNPAQRWVPLFLFSFSFRLPRCVSFAYVCVAARACAWIVFRVLLLSRNGRVPPVYVFPSAVALS